MSIYWAGGEDISFPLGQTVAVSTTASNFRGAAMGARCSLNGNSNTLSVRSLPFAVGALTSAWITCRVTAGNNPPAAGTKIMSFGTSGTEKCLGVGINNGTGGKVCIFTFNGTTKTDLASESGTSYVAGSIQRFDMQVSNFGATCTVTVYYNNTALVTFTGDVTQSGAMTSFDSVYIHSNHNTSEFVVSNFDTRSLQGLQTMALTGAGDANTWTNPTFSNINQVSFSDATPTNSNVAAQDNEYNITDPIPASYFPVAVVISARCAVSAGPTATQIKFGYKATGGAGPSFGTGSTKTPAAAYGTIEQIDQTNPLTSAAWAQTDMNGLQVAFQSV